jgi:hypothetical protein
MLSPGAVARLEVSRALDVIVVVLPGEFNGRQITSLSMLSNLHGQVVARQGVGIGTLQ